ncbi:uncharacterized protein JCM6883_000826 [Sporobolomyces salmoneus]|uniref:uncharacterized protein n=1 Tax=Sporobolomyces salmoneus TaxID=183962 RepID=UPI0031807BD4
MAAPLILGLWSVVLEPGKTISQNTSPAIQITNVSYGPEVKGDKRSAVMMKYPEFEQDSDDEDDEEEEEDDEDEEGNIKLPKLITKETVLAVLKPNVNEQSAINVCLVEDVEVVELSVSGENPVYITGHYIRQEDFDQDPYSDSEDGSDFDGDEFDDSDISGLIGEGSEDDESMMDASSRIEELKEEKPSKKRSAETASAADDSTVSAADLAGLSKNQKKKLLKAKNGEAVAAPVAAAASPAAAKKEEKKPEKKAAAAAAGPKSQHLAGGLEITDAKTGTGASAKSGSKVGMRYIGKLENGKVFDSNTKGQPLTFTLGRGQVISGWDKGIVGMQVGGERKLKIPAAMAYGKKGTQGIPPNSTLLFDVNLGVQLLDVSLLGIITGTSINDLVQKSWDWTLLKFAHLCVALLAVVTLVSTLWAIWRGVRSMLGMLDFDEDEEDEARGIGSHLPMILAGCLAFNSALWIILMVKGELGTICTGFGLSNTTCAGTVVTVLFNILFVASMISQLIFLAIIGFGSIKLKLPSFNRRKKAGGKKHHLRNRLAKIKRRRKHRHSIGKAERRGSFEGDEMRGLGEWSSGSSVFSDDSESEGDSGRRIANVQLRRKDREIGQGLSDEELARSRGGN